MNQFQLLKPEQAAKLAREKVAAFKLEQAKVKASGKKNPAPAVEGPAPDLSKKTKEELNALLLITSVNGSAEKLERLLKAGADVNARGELGKTALMLAAEWGNTETARWLIANGPGVNAGDINRGTALMGAAYYGHKEVVQLLIDAGANVNAKDGNGQTALTLAACNVAVGNKSKEISELLKAHGAE